MADATGDATTAQMRWWDGAQWTEHVRPAPQYGAAALSEPALQPAAKNPAAVAALIVYGINLVVTLVGFIVPLTTVISGYPQSDSTEIILTTAWIVRGVLVAASFTLAIIGMVTAIRRPTRKLLPVVALVLTSLDVLWVVGGLVTRLLL